MGALSALRSASHLGRHIGIMITASHNVEADNGVKLVEPMGEMLVVDWETAATELANAGDDTYASTLSTVVAQLGVVLDANTRMRVHIGNDTRISSSHLVAAARAGVRSVNITGVVADIIEHGLVTTPLLHYLVRTANDPSYGVSSNQGYFDKLASAFIKLIEVGNNVRCGQHAFLQPVDKACMASSVHVDCANGVGSMAITQFLLAYKRLQLPAHASWTISVHNTGGGELNANVSYHSWTHLKHCSAERIM
jgi:phosphoacetylglucosamine mutase